MTPVEIWKPVVGFETSYEVSNMGRIRSRDRSIRYERVDQYSGRKLSVLRHYAGRVLAPGTAESGHQVVVLGRGNSRLVHRLVLEAFVGPCPGGKEGCHENDQPSDNRLTNLRWGTRAENMADFHRNRGHHQNGWGGGRAAI